jgi:hypothetical protein
MAAGDQCYNHCFGPIFGKNGKFLESYFIITVFVGNIGNLESSVGLVIALKSM